MQSLLPEMSANASTYSVINEHEWQLGLRLDSVALNVMLIPVMPRRDYTFRIFP